MTSVEWVCLLNEILIPIIFYSITSAKILDPFEMGDFGTNAATSQDLENAIGLLDKRIMEMKVNILLITFI